MSKETTGRGETVNVKFWAEKDLLDWIDQEAVKRDRTRAYLLNEAIRQRMQRIERGRQRARKGA